MSIKSWKEEFYPVGARALCQDPSASTVDLIKHSLKKWIGLRKENIGKHALAKSGRSLVDFARAFPFGESFEIDGASCALCVKFNALSMDEEIDDDCLDCPIVSVNEGFTCDGRTPNSLEYSYEDDREIYNAWASISSDPEPMIAVLEKALKLATKEEGNV